MVTIKSDQPYDCTEDTKKHIRRVKELCNQLIQIFERQIQKHDDTKLQSPEKEYFDMYTPKLKDCTYGSDEYKQYLKELQVALKHHYASHRHHPEHFENGMSGMTLIDLLEMLADWKASVERHKVGNIIASIELNKERFGYNNMMAQIFKNTVALLK